MSYAVLPVKLVPETTRPVASGKEIAPPPCENARPEPRRGPGQDRRHVYGGGGGWSRGEGHLGGGGLGRGTLAVLSAKTLPWTVSVVPRPA